ncbi:STAS domain-containing protein [Microbacterium albipurpureum]|uniref:STAS domain-containing protein n=1 Tax=Microbacterium albipurpureum TaxID=3050384 RepID=UPI003BF4A359
MFERFSKDMGLHVMEVPAAARSVIRSNHVRGSGDAALRVFELQGGIRFAGAERVVREVVETAPGEPRVALDFTAVHSADDVARRMLVEVARRLSLDGHDVFVVDPDGIVADPGSSADRRFTVIGRIDGAEGRVSA